MQQGIHRIGIFFQATGHLLLNLTILLSFNMAAQSADQCPKMNDHSLSAVHYKLFTAFQTVYDGYGLVCENKCLGRTDCAESCQTEKALKSLSIKLAELNNSMPNQSCISHSLVCVDQCKQYGDACQQACGLSESVATN